MVEGVTSQTNTALLIQAGEGGVPSPPPSSSEAKQRGAGAPAQAAGARSIPPGDVPQAARNAAAQYGETDQSGSVADQKKLEEMVRELNEKLYSLNSQLQFRIDKDLNRTYISIVDRKTKEVIKEIPPEEIRHLMAQMREYEESIQFHAGKGGGGRDLFVNVEV